jgi:hypothetical protein
MFHRPAFPCSLGNQSSGAKKDETSLMSVARRPAPTVPTKTHFLTYYGLGITNELQRHHDIISTVRGGQDIITGIIYTVSSVMCDTLFPLFSLG